MAPTLAQVLQGFAAANAAAKPVPLPQGRLPGVPPPVVKNAPTFDLTASPFAGAQHPFAQAQHQAAVKLDRAQRAGPNGRLPLAPAQSLPDQIATGLSRPGLPQLGGGGSPGNTLLAGIVNGNGPRVPQTARDELVEQGFLQRTDTGLLGGLNHLVDSEPSYKLGPNAPSNLKQQVALLRSQISSASGGSVVPQGAASTVAKGLQAVTGAASNKTFLGRAYNSAVNLPQQALPSTVATVKALGSAVTGDTKPLGQIGASLANTVTHPLESFNQDPFGTALLFHGGIQAVDRTAGAVARSGALGAGVKGAASRERAPLTLYASPKGDVPPVQIDRQYQPGLVTKQLQTIPDRIRSAQGDPNPNVASGARLQRAVMGGNLISNHLLPVKGVLKPGVVDKYAAGAEAHLRRMYDRNASALMGSIKPAHGADLVSLAAEGVLRAPETFRPDLVKEQARLVEAAKGLGARDDRRGLELNQRNQQAITDALANPKLMADPRAVFEAAHTYASWHAPLEQRKVDLGLMEPDQLHAKYQGYAQAHMDATFNENPGAHPLVGAISDARAREAAANSAIVASRKARDNARAPNPRLPVDHPVTLARNALQRAKLGEAHAEGRSTPNFLNPAKLREDVPRAKAEYDRAHAEHRLEVEAAHGALLEHASDVAHHRGELEGGLKHLKEAGIVRPNGDLWPGLDKAGGGHLPTQEIIDHIRAGPMGERPVGFITHKDGVTHGNVTHSFLRSAPGGERSARTGVRFDTGAYDRSFDALHRQARKTANRLAGGENYNEMLRRFGIGRYEDKAVAEKARSAFLLGPDGKRVEGGLGDLVVRQVGSARVLSHGNVQTRGASSAMHDFHVVESKAAKEAETPTWTLIPKHVDDRLSAHDKLNGSSDSARLAQWYTNKWRSAALFTSPRWAVGNPQEHAFRLAAANVNPAVAFLGRFSGSPALQVGKAITEHFRQVAADESRSPQERYIARDQVANYDGGTNYGSLLNVEIRRSASDVPGAVKTFADSLNETAPVSAMTHAWATYKGALSHMMHLVESNTKQALLGKQALKEARTFTRDWKGLISRQDEAIRRYAEGKLDPNAAAKLGNDVIESAGNWHELTPTVRRAVQNIAPFGLWWLTSMKFVYRTLPRDHPFKTAALAAMESGTAGVRPEQTQEYLKGGVQLHLPILGDVTVLPQYYSPFGVGVEPIKTAIDSFIPQYKDPGLTALGVNPLRLDKERGNPDSIAELSHAGAQALTGVTPFARQAEQLYEQGGQPDPTSANPFATKPGTQRGYGVTAAKILFPTRVVQASKGGGSGKSSGSYKDILGTGGSSWRDMLG